MGNIVKEIKSITKKIVKSRGWNETPLEVCCKKCKTHEEYWPQLETVTCKNCSKDIKKEYKKNKNDRLEKWIQIEKNSGKKEKEDKENIIYTSLIIKENKIVEQVYKDKKSQYCIYDDVTKTFQFYESFNNGGIIHKPIGGEEIEKNVIKLPSEPLDYGNDSILETDLKSFIRKWLDIPEDILQFAIWNIKRSWVFDKFHTLNYLRALGDTGQGKSRFLDVLGYLHYKPIATSGATTASPVFRVIEKWKGTLIMDEADFQRSDEAQDMIKIINQGYEKEKYIMRCDPNNVSKINYFDPFCPKILATRKSFQDKATESRCITYVMKGTQRNDIPLNLNKSFWDDTQILRNKLLKWRFDNYFKISTDENITLDMVELEPRLRQIVSSFVCLFKNDKKQVELFKSFIQEKQEEIIEERRNSFDGTVVESLHKLLESGQNDINLKDIIEAGDMKNKSGNLINSRSLNSTIKSLGLKIDKPKRVDGKTKKCIILDKEILDNIFKRYALPCYDVYGCYGVNQILNKGEIELPSDSITENVTVGGTHHMQGNNRNNVTKKDVFDDKYDDLKNSKDEVLIQDIIGKLGEGVAEPLLEMKLKKGDYFVTKPGYIKRS